MGIAGFDHVALPTADSERFIAFYRSLGFDIDGEEAWRAGTSRVFSITFGDNKINVHPEAMVARRGNPTYLRGPTAEPGCGDFCFVWEGTADALQQLLADAGAEVEEGPVERRGGRGGGRTMGTSVYTRDPDGNLLEFISYP